MSNGFSLRNANEKLISHHYLGVVGWNSETFPDILFQLPDVHSFCALCIVDKLWTDASCLALRLREQILLSWVGGPRHITVKAVVEAGAIVVIVMEELGIEWDSAPISG